MIDVLYKQELKRQHNTAHSIFVCYTAKIHSLSSPLLSFLPSLPDSLSHPSHQPLMVCYLSLYLYICIYLPFLFCSCVEHCDGNLQEKRVETFDLHIHILFIGVVFSVLRLYIYLNSQFVPLLIVSST